MKLQIRISIELYNNITQKKHLEISPTLFVQYTWNKGIIQKYELIQLTTGTTAGATSPNKNIYILKDVSFLTPEITKESRYYDNICFSILTKTKTSGINQLDEIENGLVMRDLRSGYNCINLGQLIDPNTRGYSKVIDFYEYTLHIYFEPTNPNDKRPDPKKGIFSIMSTLLLDKTKERENNEILENIFKRKNDLDSITEERIIELLNSSSLSSQLEDLEYTPKVEEVIKNNIIEPYLAEYTEKWRGKIDQKTGKIIKEGQFSSSIEKIKDLHVPVILMDHLYFIFTMFFWTYDPFKFIRTKKTEEYILFLFNLLKNRYKITDSYFMEITQKQFNEEGDILHNEFIKIISHLVELICMPSTSCYYIVDIAISNDGRSIQNERFHYNTIQHISKSCDCEDDGETNDKLYLIIYQENYISEIMNMIQRVIKLFVGIGVVSGVTSPSADTQSTKKEDKLKYTLYNSQSYDKERNDGHVYLLLVNWYIIQKWYKNSNIDIEIPFPLGYPEWAKKLPKYIGEGTGYVKPLPLPILEYFDKTQSSFISIEKYETNKKKIIEMLMNEYSLLRYFDYPSENMNIHETKESKGRTISFFYRFSIHGYSSILFDISPNLGQFAFLNNKTNKYGITFRLMCEDKGEEIKLEPHYSDKKWNNIFINTKKIIERQLPSFHFTEIENKNEEDYYTFTIPIDYLGSLSSNIVPQLGTSTKTTEKTKSITTITDLTTISMSKLNKIIEKTKEKEREKGKKIPNNIGEDKNFIVIPFYSKEWRFKTEKDSMINILNIINSLIEKKVLGLIYYEFSIEKVMPQLDPNIILVLVFDQKSKE